MPWEVKKVKGSYAVVKKGTSKVVSMHGSDRGKALSHVRALYANYKGGKPGMIAGHGPSSSSTSSSSGSSTTAIGGPVHMHEARHNWRGEPPTEEQRAEAAKRRTEKFAAWKTKREEKLKAAGKYDENKEYWWEKEGAEQQWAQRRRARRHGHWYGNHGRYGRRMRRRWGQNKTPGSPASPVKPTTPGDTKNTSTSGS